MDRELKEFLIAVEKTNDRMLTTLSRVLAADAGKADERTSRVTSAVREVDRTVWWGFTVLILTAVPALIFIAVLLLRGH